MTDNKYIDTGEIITDKTEIDVDSISSGAVVVADIISVKTVNSGGIVIADKVIGLNKITSGGVVISPNIPADITMNSGAKTFNTVERYVSHLQNELSEIEKEIKKSNSVKQFLIWDKESIERDLEKLREADVL